jgi:site-specific recombinase XerD
VSSYLVHRPSVVARQIFLRVRAPHRPLHKVAAVVFAASQRAGLAPVRPHRLRRTAATEMLRRGASLGEIAEVLRHTSTQTTAIYAKVDRQSLRAVVQPWPGARS